uniref:Uncharacterized protein n=1 Tax=Vespula pensylvanica TaxID=30213 RepID=A0A834N4W8_VESPE|nr:hypothetical protein H0235_017038 [Vespula pensylvanica]
MAAPFELFTAVPAAVESSKEAKNLEGQACDNSSNTSCCFQETLACQTRGTSSRSNRLYEMNIIEENNLTRSNPRPKSISLLTFIYKQISCLSFVVIRRPNVSSMDLDGNDFRLLPQVEGGRDKIREVNWVKGLPETIPKSRCHRARPRT